jgi:hypothetical protein
MATTHNHAKITHEVLQEFGFNQDAREVAADADVAVDAYQGNNSCETDLHAMAGMTTYTDLILFRPAVKMQSSEETAKAVARQLQFMKEQTVKAVENAQANALVLLGQALHTIQDRAFHSFEPWPYSGIGDSILKNPNYMFGHFVRDLGIIGKLDFDDRGFAVNGTIFRLSRNAYLGAEFSYGSRPDMNSDLSGRPAGVSGMMTLTFGAPPGSVRPNERTSAVLSKGADRYDSADYPALEMATSGPAAYKAAENATHYYVSDLRAQVLKAEEGNQLWTEFINNQLKSKADSKDPRLEQCKKAVGE